MSEKMHESMSALMDGEATDFEARRLLEQMDSPEMREKWSRYHLASAAMKRDSAAGKSQIDISAAVSAAIANESKGVAPQRKPLRAMAGFASAAAIAFVAVIGVQSFDHGVQGTLDNSIAVVPVDTASALSKRAYSNHSAGTVAPVTLVSTGAVSQSGFQDVSLNAVPDSNAQSRLENYMARHAEFAGTRNAALTTAPAAHWQASWLPEGYRLVAVNNAVSGDSVKPELTSVYSNGMSAFSVFVSNVKEGMPSAMDLRRGDTIACSRRIQAGGTSYNATVVGNIPQSAAARIATSVRQSDQ